MVYVLDERARASEHGGRARARRRGDRRRRPRDATCRPRRDEASIASERGELRFAPGGDSRTCAAGAGASRASSPRSARDVAGRAPAEPRLPRRARPRLVGAHLPDRGRRAAVGRARLRVRRLGRRRPRRRRQPRLAAPQRLARRAAVVRHRPRARATRASSGRCRTCCRWSPGTSAWATEAGLSRSPPGATLSRMPDDATAVALPLHRRVRHGLRQPHNWLQLVRFARRRRERLRRQPRVFALARARARRSTTASPRCSRSSSRSRTTSGGTATGRSARATVTPASRRRASWS